MASPTITAAPSHQGPKPDWDTLKAAGIVGGGAASMVTVSIEAPPGIEVSVVVNGKLIN